MTTNANKSFKDYFNRDLIGASLTLIPAALLYILSYTFPALGAFSLIWQWLIPASIVSLCFAVGFNYLNTAFRNITNCLKNFKLATLKESFFDLWRAFKGEKIRPFRLFDMNLLVSLSLTTSIFYGLILGPSAHLVVFISPILTLGALKLSSYFKGRIELDQINQTAAKPNWLDELYNRSILKHKNCKKGELYIIGPGDYIPVDGKLALCDSAKIHDHGVMTGDYTHHAIQTKLKDEPVWQGNQNESGHIIRIRSVCDTNESYLAQRISDIRFAKIETKTSNYVNSMVTIFIPIILAVATVGLLTWGTVISWNMGFNVMMNVLFSACPCALVLIRDLPYSLLKKIASANNIFFKKDSMIEKLAELVPEKTTFVFDLTNTLTKLKYVDTHGLTDDFDDLKPTLLKHVLALENARTTKENLPSDPYATAIKSALNETHRDKTVKATLLKDTDGQLAHNGVVGSVNNQKQYWIGDYNLLTKNGFVFSSELKRKLSDLGIKLLANDEIVHTASAASQQAALQNKTFVYVGTEVDGQKEIVAYIEFEYDLKPDAKSTINSLMECGFNTHILTGSSSNVAKEFAKQLGINYFHAGLTPQGKAKIIDIFQKEKHKLTYEDLEFTINTLDESNPDLSDKELNDFIEKLKEPRNVIMVGDGINDYLAANESSCTIGSICVGKDSCMRHCFDVSVNELTDILKLLSSTAKTINTQKNTIKFILAYTLVSIFLATIVFPLSSMTMMMGCFGLCMASTSLIAAIYTALLTFQLNKIIEPQAPPEYTPTNCDDEFTCSYSASCCDTAHEEYIPEIIKVFAFMPSTSHSKSPDTRTIVLRTKQDPTVVASELMRIMKNEVGRSLTIKNPILDQQASKSGFVVKMLSKITTVLNKISGAGSDHSEANSTPLTTNMLNADPNEEVNKTTFAEASGGLSSQTRITPLKDARDSLSADMMTEAQGNSDVAAAAYTCDRI